MANALESVTLPEYARVSPRRLHEDIVEQIASQIIFGEFPVESLLPSESELSSRFGVSRTVVREAIRVLAAKGLVAVRQGSGIWVLTTDRWNLLDTLVLTTRLRTSPDDQLIDDLFEAREAIEVEVAMLAARRRTQADLSNLGDIVQRMREVGLSDRQEYSRLDLRFHHGLFLAARNQVLQQMAWTTVETMVVAGGRSSRPEAIRHDDSQRSHELVFEAIQAGDAMLAREEVCRLLRITKDTLRRSLPIVQSPYLAGIGGQASP